MKKSDFFYDLPEELIAQTPLERRDASRLLLLDRATGALSHRHFSDLPSLLRAGDCLVLNDTRVLPARLYGTRRDTGAKVEFLLLKRREALLWEAIAGPGKKAKPGAQFDFSTELAAEVCDVLPDGNRLLRFSCAGDFDEILERIGETPLPHYIHTALSDRERYQTVYAREPGSAAAPTAGLHFTDALLDRLRADGVSIANVTLHVGLGTFRPVKTEEITQHKMHTEHYVVPPETAALLRKTKENGGRVICVGTTSCRTLESMMRSYGEICACAGDTDIFIYPGYEFQCMDGLITNFHLPESTLIMLVAAFAGYENTMCAYKTAVAERYRFFSFGDAMAIL